MSEISIRIYSRDANGNLLDANEEFDISNFAGEIPVVGDKILGPWVAQGLSRILPDHRELYTVTERIFNPRDMKDYVILVCSVTMVSDKDTSLLPPG